MFKKNELTKKRGFTLIELLVVISIISFLSSVVFSSLNSAREKARNMKRVEELKSISLALEMYRTQFGTFPSYIPSSSGVNVYENASNDFESIAQVLVSSGFLSSVPRDPKHSMDMSNIRGYFAVNTGVACTGLLIFTRLENPPNPSAPFGSNRYPSPPGVDGCYSGWSLCRIGNTDSAYCLGHPY